MKTTMTKDEQKIQNTKIRLAVKTGELPYTFYDIPEKRDYYQKIIRTCNSWGIGKFSLTEIEKGKWTIDIA